MKRVYLVASVVLCLALAGCGSPAANPTAAAPAEPATSAPQPTVAPSATVAPTVAPTATSAPGEIGSAAQLGLPAEFVPVTWDELTQKFPPKLAPAAGLAILKLAYYPKGLIPWAQFPLKASFAFVNGDNTKFIHGFTVDLPAPKDQSTFDGTFVDEFYAKWRISVPPKYAASIKGVTVGDKSSAVTANPPIDGFVWRLNAVAFRVGSTGAFVFTLYPADADAPIDIVKLAQAYAATLK